MVFKIEKNKNYTIMSNYHLRDKDLSYKAKGLLSFMLSLPETWDYSMNGLVAVSKENIKAIRSILNELKEKGYLEIKQTRGEKGYYKYEYIIREYPINMEKSKNNPYTQKGITESGRSEKETEITTKKEKDKGDKENKSSFFNAKDHNPLTIDLISKKFISEDDVQIFFYDSLFDEALEENNYRDLIVISHYIIEKIISRNYRDENNKQIENLYGYFKNAFENNIEKLKNRDKDWDDDIGWFKELDDYDLDI